jgi:hypothetical protein
MNNGQQADAADVLASIGRHWAGSPWRSGPGPSATGPGPVLSMPSEGTAPCRCTEEWERTFSLFRLLV